MDDGRPDPDALLAQLKQEEAQAERGKLKIYFGASAGVGKTYAMLSAARAAREQGIDVVIGVVETHGRAETEALRRRPRTAAAQGGGLSRSHAEGIRPRRARSRASPR